MKRKVALSLSVHINISQQVPDKDTSPIAPLSFLLCNLSSYHLKEKEKKEIAENIPCNIMHFGKIRIEKNDSDIGQRCKKR